MLLDDCWRGWATCSATTRTASPTRRSSTPRASASRSRQHAILLGSRVDDGCAPTTVLAFDVGESGFVPQGLQVRMRTSPDELPVTFTVARRTRVMAGRSSDALTVAAFPDAFDAERPGRRHRAAALGRRCRPRGRRPPRVRAGLVLADRDPRGAGPHGARRGLGRRPLLATGERAGGADRAALRGAARAGAAPVGSRRAAARAPREPRRRRLRLAAPRRRRRS